MSMQSFGLTCVAWSTSKDVWLAVSEYRLPSSELYWLTRTWNHQSTDIQARHSWSERTDSLLPGNFTVVYCSSLYFLNADSSDSSNFGSLLANVLMSVPILQRFVHAIVHPLSNVPATTLESCASQLHSWTLERPLLPTSPGGAVSMNDAIVACFDPMLTI